VGGEAFWAPNAITYGYDSRAASIRIISPPSVPPPATRFEIRVTGADMNAYFALSAIFLLGLRGIDKKMKLEEPPISLQDREKVAFFVPDLLRICSVTMLGEDVTGLVGICNAENDEAGEYCPKRRGFWK
jgi:hypothetical protein